MQKLILKILLLITIVSFQTKKLFAQRSSLDSNVVISIGEYRPTIADANKISENPSVSDSTKKLPVKGYNITSKKINTNYDVTPIPAAQMVGEPLKKLYNALVKVGYGNYNTPYGEVWYNNLRSKEYSYGVRLKHLSSSASIKDYGYAGYGDDEVSLYGKEFLSQHTLSGNFDYSRNLFHYYGYDANLHSLDRGTTLQRFNYFGASADLMSHFADLEELNHDINVSYYNITDLYKVSENNIKLKGYVQTMIEKNMLKVDASLDYYNDKSLGDTINNTILAINPKYIFIGKKYRASFGITAALDVSKRTTEDHQSYIYPDIDLSYNVLDNVIIPFAGANGGLQRNSFKNLTDENPFVSSYIDFNNTSNKYNLYGGIKGALTSHINYLARATYADIGNLAMFVNDSKDLLSNKFDVIYDDATEINIRGEVGYQMREKLRIGISGDYFNYKMTNEIRAWYKPQVKVAATCNYNLSDKIVAKIDLFYIGEQYAKVSNDIYAATYNGEKVTAKLLDGYFDANIGVEYRYNKKLGFFITLNNITNVGSYSHYRYSNYPTQRFNGMIGASYSF